MQYVVLSASTPIFSNDKALGYLLNFGEALMKDGITRTIHGTL